MALSLPTDHPSLKAASSSWRMLSSTPMDNRTDNDGETVSLAVLPPLVGRQTIGNRVYTSHPLGRPATVRSIRATALLVSSLYSVPH